MIIGLFILVIGILLLLNNLNIGVDIGIRQILRLWPVIPLVLGLSWLASSIGSTTTEEGKKTYFFWGQFVADVILIAIGVIYLGRNLDLFDFNTAILWNLIWPVILILIGFNLLRGKAHGGGGRFTFMGGTKLCGSQPWKL
ncbi:MAG: DUF5668 domain-containing protein [Bacillota bacterium]|nr:DUF5668 domain-containing protein [Bacillota bacterium]